MLSTGGQHVEYEGFDNIFQSGRVKSHLSVTFYVLVFARLPGWTVLLSMSSPNLKIAR